jgi:transportin-3
LPVLEDYLSLCSAMASKTPDLLIFSPHLPATLATVASALSLTHPSVLRTAIDYLMDLLGHESLAPVPPPGVSPQYTPLLKTAIQQTGHALVNGLFYGLVAEFEDTASTITAFRLFAERFPNDLMVWLPAAMKQIPPSSLSAQDLQHFTQDFNQSVSMLRQHSLFLCRHTEQCKPGAFPRSGMRSLTWIGLRDDLRYAYGRKVCALRQLFLCSLLAIRARG